MDEYNFSEEQQRLLQQKAIVEALRQQSQQQAPQGQMISGHYVAPSILQQLLPAIQSVQARSAQNDLNKAELAQAGRLSQARAQWAATQPQAQPAQAGNLMAGQGPLQENQDTPAVPVQAGQILKHAMAGLAIPGNEKAAQIYQTGALADQSREDTQLEKRNTLVQTMQLQREKQAQELEFKRQKLEQDAQALQDKLEQKGLDRQSAERLNALLLQSKAAHNATLLEIAKLRGTGNTDKKTHEIELGVEKMSRRAEPIIQVLQPAGEIQKLIDDATGPDGTVKPIPGFGLGTRLKSKFGMQAAMSPAETKAFQAQQAFGNALIREQAGLSQTLSEQEKALAEQMRQGTAGQQEFLNAWPGLREKLNAKVGVVRTYAPEIHDVFDSRNVNTPFKPITSRFSKGASKLTPAEQAELEALRGGK
jgi:hypothetical protein